MKLTTILTNNGETLKGANKGNVFVNKLDNLIRKATARSTEVLLYATELSEEDVNTLDKNLHGRTSHITSKNESKNDFRVAFASNEKVIFDDSQVLVPFGGKLPGVVAVCENGEDSYAGTLMHLHPYAGSKKNLYGILANGNPERFEDIKAGITATRYQRHALKQKGLSSKEFHTGYYDMYGSIFFNLLLGQGQHGLIPQKEFIEKMTEAHLHPVGNLAHYTYETHKFRYPIRFRGIHTFATKETMQENEDIFVDQDTSVEIIPPEGTNDRATVISKFEW